MQAAPPIPYEQTSVTVAITGKPLFCKGGDANRFLRHANRGVLRVATNVPTVITRVRLRCDRFAMFMPFFRLARPLRPFPNEYTTADKTETFGSMVRVAASSGDGTHSPGTFHGGSFSNSHSLRRLMETR